MEITSMTSSSETNWVKNISFWHKLPKNDMFLLSWSWYTINCIVYKDNVKNVIGIAKNVLKKGK